MLDEPTATAPLLEVEDLHVRFDSPQGTIHAVRGTTFTVGAGETLGIVGESGSGKSVTARAIMRLLPSPPAHVTGRIHFDGVELSALPRHGMRDYRGSQIAMVYQDALRALNPTMRIGDQISEAVRAHDRGISGADARTRTLELLDAVQIPAAATRFDAYPHQLSGGMRQRVVIAMALSCRPRLLIADEPTTALDVTVQAAVLDLLSELQEELQMAMILVTHDLGVAAWHTHRIMVMYAGKLVEQAPTTDLFDNMRMPYTRGLFDSIPRLDRPSHELRTIDGRPADASEEIAGCAFAPRCVRVHDTCRDREPPTTRDGAHEWACWDPLDNRSSVASRWAHHDE